MLIVTGERRKSKKKQVDGRRTYRKKANAVRLCADDLLTRERLVAYHDSYAAAMVSLSVAYGGELRHTTTGQYYRESLINFSRNTLHFSERVIKELCKLKKVRLKGNFYSPEFNRKFRDENAAFSFEEDKNSKGHYHICVNDILLVQWFRQKANEWRNGLGIAPTRQDKGLKI